MAFSYCATEMSRLTVAILRLARLAPPSKIGSVICGAKLQLPEPPLKRPESSPLDVPADAVRLMRG